MAEVSIFNFKWPEKFRYARFITPGRIFAVGDAANINDVGDIVRLDQRHELHEAKAIMTDREYRLSHNLLYIKMHAKINNLRCGI